MTDIDKAAREYARVKHGDHECWEIDRVESAKDFLAGHNSRQPEIDELIEAVEEISKEWREFDNYSNGDDGYYVGLELSIKGTTQLLEKYGKK